MPDTTITVPPFILVKPKILLGTAGSGVDIACAANQVTAEPEQDENVTETFCGIYTNYKAEAWTITVTAVQSYGVGGLWNSVRPLCGTVVPFTLLPNGAIAAGPANPSMTGTCYVKGFPFIDGAVGEASEFDLELAVQGVPVFALALSAEDEARMAALDDEPDTA